MKSIRVPAEIIITFPTQVKPSDDVVATACFACEQHLNSIGMINYNGPMIATGTLSFGLRVHMGDPPQQRGIVMERFPELLEAKKAEPE